VPAPEEHRVLVVDDEPSIVDVLTMALRFQGFAVATAATGQEALAQVAAFRPHLVLLDVMLPDLDGFAVAERLGAQRAGVPIVFLTARDGTPDKVRGLLENVWSYDFGGDGRILETYVSYLRRKLDAHGPPPIHTARGVGCALRLPR